MIVVHSQETAILLNTRQAADVLGLKPHTLYVWRSQKRGPKFIRVGTRAVRYRFSDLLDWIASSESQASR